MCVKHKYSQISYFFSRVRDNGKIFERSNQACNRGAPITDYDNCVSPV